MNFTAIQAHACALDGWGWTHKHWRASFGIDNLTDNQHWNFHTYSQRSCVAEMKFDW